MGERIITANLLVPARRREVWRAWTTEAGIRTFFAPAGCIDLRPDGPYEIYFDPVAEAGSRGGEGMRVLAVQEPELLSFTWNAPPSLPTVRAQRTSVLIRLDEAPGDRTRLQFHHSGWGNGGEWDQAFSYFEHAWLHIVLPRLIWRFINGPLDWNDPPASNTLADVPLE